MGHSITVLTVLFFSFASIWGHVIDSSGVSAHQAHAKPSVHGPKPTTGCRANICFAIDGSASIGIKAFQQQKKLAETVVHLITSTGTAGFAAVQYGVASVAISPYTTDVPEFLRHLRASRQEMATQTFMVAGINYCFRELYTKTGKNKIVLLGDGSSTLGSDPVLRAKLFRDLGGDICVVGVGKSPDVGALFAIVGGNSDKAFTINKNNSIKKVAAEMVGMLCA